ncbi:hypothetical protein [Thermanaeromonas sp. C210]|nr:hypothetical protein [Thermanaeromonas sp. C210]
MMEQIGVLVESTAALHTDVVKSVTRPGGRRLSAVVKRRKLDDCRAA